MGLLVTIGLSSIGDFMREKSFTSVVQNAKEQIIYQREKSIGSVSDQEYGFVVSSNSLILFNGSSYSASDPDNLSLSLGNITLSPAFMAGTTTIYFSQVYGTPNATGTIAFSDSVSAQTATITIYASGLIE